MATVVHQMPSFRHAFYAIAIKLEGRGKAITGHHTNFPEGTTIFFNSPFQILSWDIAPDWEGYYLMFSQDFVAGSHHFNHLLKDFPFLKIDTSIPFEVGPTQVAPLLDIYKHIQEAYHSNHTDKFDFIESYTLLLLNYINRYFRQQVSEAEAHQAIRRADISLTSRYKSLIESRFQSDQEIDHPKKLHSTRYYADEMNIHPNHLNAVIKSITGHTALQLIHQHVLRLAKAQLAQTNQSIKEIAYDLHFTSPNNFSSFFKKYTDSTPLAYRNEANI